MGYCSDVALVLKAEIVESFDQIFGYYYAEEQELKYFWEKCKQHIRAENGDALYYWRYIKWHHQCQEVDRVERWMNQLDNENLSDQYLFVRMGEEWEDIEYRGNFEDENGENPFDIEVVREITFYGKRGD
jgi:hypothetical protein